MRVDFLDPINQIVLEEAKKLGPGWKRSTKNWHKVFQKSLKKFFFFPLANEKWTYWVFMQPHAVWPIHLLTPKELYLLRFAKLLSHLNPKKVYVDRGFNIDPERPDRTFSIEDTANGLRLWAAAFQKKIYSTLIRQLKAIEKTGVRRIMEECPNYFNDGQPCTEKEAKELFYSRMYKLARHNAISLPQFTNKALSLLEHLHRV